MKIFNKILAMVLALMTVVVMLPVSAFADAWLDVTSQTKAENSTITVTVDAKALAEILQNNGISKSLIKEIIGATDLDVDALKKVFTLKELFEIVPKKDLMDLIDPAEIIEQLDFKTLMGYVDVKALLKNIDVQDLLDLLPANVELSTIVDLEVLIDAVDVDYVLDQGYVDVDGLAADLLEVLDVNDLVDLAGDNLTDVVDFEKLFDDEVIELTTGLVSIEDIQDAGLITNALLQDLIDGDAFKMEELENYFKTLPTAKDYFDTAKVKNLIDIDDYISDFDYTDFEVDESMFNESDVDLTSFDPFTDYEIDAVTGTVTLRASALEAVKADPEAYLTDSGMEKLEALVDVDAIYDQVDIDAILENVEMTALAGCIKLEKALAELEITEYFNYNKVVSIIGVNTIINNENITIDYDAIDLSGIDNISDYLKDGYLDHIDTEALIDEAEANGIMMLDYVDKDAVFEDDTIMGSVDLETAVDVDAFLDKVDMNDLLNLIGMDAIMDQLETNELLEILSTIDIKPYIESALVLIIGKVLTNVDQLSIDGNVIAAEDKVTAQLEFFPGNLAKALLKAIPTLDDIAGIQNNVVFSTTLGLVYTADDNAATNAGKTKAKNITVNFVLEGDLTPVKNAAAKLSSLLKKYIDFDIAADGSIYLGLDLPTVATPEILTVFFNKALESGRLSDATKVKLLNLVNVDGNAVAGFVDSLTLEDIIAVLDAVEPSALYESFLNISYVEAALEKVSAKIGYDLTSVSLDDMKYAIANVPSMDRIFEIIENKTGRDVMAILEKAADKIDGLTEKDAVAKLLDILEEKTGYNFDISVADVLDRAADVEISEKISQLAARKIGVDVREVLNTYTVDQLWDEAVARAATKEGIYNKVKNYALVVADLIPDKMMSICIADLYRGNSVFGVEDLSVSFSEKAIAEKALSVAFRVATNLNGYADKLADKLGVDIAVVEKYLNKIDSVMDRYLTAGLMDKLLSKVPNGTLTGSLSFGVSFTDVYKITYMDRDAEKVLFSAFLPAGADLSIFKTDSSVTGYDIADWTDADGNAVLTMPAADTVVYADRNAIEVTFTDVDGTVLKSLLLKSGDCLPEGMLDELNAMVTTGAIDEKLFDKYIISWLNASGETVDLTQPITESATFTATTAPDYYFELEEHDWSIEYIEGLYRVTIHSALASSIRLDLLRSYILADAVTFANDGVDHEDIRLEFVFDNGNTDSSDDFTFLFFDNANLKALYNNTAEGDSVVFAYDALASVENPIYGNVANASFFNFDILVNGTAKETTFTDAKMTITVPYANAVSNGANGEETRVHVVTETAREWIEATVNMTAGLITFNAPHFSQFVVSNEYKLDIVFEDTTGKTITDCTVNNPGDMYFPGETVLKLADLYTVPATYEIDSVTADKGSINAAMTEFTMPADSGATITVVVKGAVYHIYYIVNGYLYEDVEYTGTTVPALKDFNITSTDSKFAPPAHYTATGGAWVGYTNTVGNQYVFAKWTAVQYKVIFSANGTTVSEQTFTYEDYKNIVAPAVPNGTNGQIGKWNVQNLTTELEKAFTAADKTVTITATYSNREFAIAGDGNVTVADKAEAGASVTVSATAKPGYTDKITVVDGNNQTVAVENGAFTMPAINVYVSVTYTANDITYTVNGTEKTGKFGTTVSFDIPVANGEMIATAPNGCTLVSYTVNPDGSAVATYAFELNAKGIAITWSKIGNAIASFYLFNGNMTNADTAPTAGAENVKFAGWTEAVAGLYFANFTVETETSLLWLWILLIVLAVILLIALIYNLYINGKLKPNFITRFVTWIVTLFFGLCLAVAAAGLWIAHLFGKGEDPAEFGVEEKAEEPTEETTEEATEETTEEATEETVEETTEEVTEENTEETTEEATEETTEEVTEETTEETAEEATEEVTEETTEETAEEATEEAADDKNRQ